MKDTYNESAVVQTIAPAVQAASADGSAVALAGFDSALVVINTGAIVGSGDFSLKLQESDTTTAGDFTDVAAADLLGTLPTTLAANTAYRIGYIDSKRKKYVRAVLTKASGTSIALGAVVMLGHPRMAPVA